MRTTVADVGQAPRRVDRNALRTNQAAVVLLIAAAFLADARWLVALVGAVLALGTVDGRLALFQRFYHRVLKGRLVRPDLREDDPAPHRFAQGVGATFLLAAAIALRAGAPFLGWALAWVVTVLAAVNLFFGFCAGCFVHYQLMRLGWIRRAGLDQR